MKVNLDTHLCALSGWCAEIEPDVFELVDTEDSAQLTTETIDDPAVAERVREAASACPTGAITIVEP